MWSRCVAGLVVVACCGSSVTAWTAPDARAHVAATQTAPVAPLRTDNPLRDPPQWVSRDGYLRVRLVAEERQVQLGGRSVQALVYNGDYMPPTIRVRPGDRLDLELVNKLPEATNLHVHGMHVSPQGNSDNVFLHIGPGQTFQYTSGCVLTTPVGTMQGTYRFWRDDGSYFDAEIAAFSLASPVRNEDLN